MARTTALNKIQKAILEPTFYKVIQGGMSAGKTFAISTCLIGYAESFPGSLTTIVGLSYPQLKGGSIRDFTHIMKEQKRWDESRWNKTELTYYFPNGSIMEFKSIDRMTAHGMRRDVLFVNEANGITWDTFDQLASRTKDFVIIDYNPSSKFWAHEELLGRFKNDTTFLLLTYKDNEALSPREIENIRSHAPKQGEEPSNWWVVYGLGQIGSLEGNVYSGWIEAELDDFHIKTESDFSTCQANVRTTSDRQEPACPDNIRLVRYGLDFGFSNDETALVAVYEIDNTSISSQHYSKNLSKNEISENLILKSKVKSEKDDAIFKENATNLNKEKYIKGKTASGDSYDKTALNVGTNQSEALFVVEVIYQKGLLGSQYAESLEKHAIRHDVLIVADSARPEIIAEIQNAGFRIIGADKNPGSVKRGIDRVMARQIYYSGTNLKREYLSYAWRKTRSGQTVDEPQDGNDHLMDALRYAIDDLDRPRFDF